MFALALLAATTEQPGFDMMQAAEASLQLCLVMEGADAINLGVSADISVVIASAVCRTEFQRMLRVYRDHASNISPTISGITSDAEAEKTMKRMLGHLRNALQKQIDQRQ